MRRVLLVLTVIAAALAAQADRPGAARAACALVVVWRDRAYFGYGLLRALPHVRPGAPLHGALEPGCADVGGEPIPAPTPVPVRAIAGVPTDVALLEDSVVLVAVGYLPQTAGFPLRWPPTHEMRGCTAGATVTLSGVARSRPGGINVVHVRSSRPVPLLDHDLLMLELDTQTRIVGLERHGAAFIADGQRVRIQARFCRVPGSTGPKVVARRIAANGPIAAPQTAEDVLGPNWRGNPGLLHDRTTLIAVILVAVGAVGALGVRAWRRSPSPGRG